MCRMKRMVEMSGFSEDKTVEGDRQGYKIVHCRVGVTASQRPSPTLRAKAEQQFSASFISRFDEPSSLLLPSHNANSFIHVCFVRKKNTGNLVFSEKRVKPCVILPVYCDVPLYE